MLRRVVDGGDVSGAELLALPRFVAMQPIEQSQRVAAVSVVGLLYQAAWVAAAVEDCCHRDELLAAAADLQVMLQAGVPIEDHHRLLLWCVGASADFAIALEPLGLLTTEEAAESKGTERPNNGVQVQEGAQ